MLGQHCGVFRFVRGVHMVHLLSRGAEKSFGKIQPPRQIQTLPKVGLEGTDLPTWKATPDTPRATLLLRGEPRKGLRWRSGPSPGSVLLPLSFSAVGEVPALAMREGKAMPGIHMGREGGKGPCLFAGDRIRPSATPPDADRNLLELNQALGQAAGDTHCTAHREMPGFLCHPHAPPGGPVPSARPPPPTPPPPAPRSPADFGRHSRPARDSAEAEPRGGCRARPSPRGCPGAGHSPGAWAERMPGVLPAGSPAQSSRSGAQSPQPEAPKWGLPGCGPDSGSLQESRADPLPGRRSLQGRESWDTCCEGPRGRHCHDGDVPWQKLRSCRAFQPRQSRWASQVEQIGSGGWGPRKEPAGLQEDR